MNDSAGEGAWRPRANPWAIALVVTLATFMEVLDTTIVNVSLPYIAGSMSSSNDESTWTLTSYLVANGIVLPISGWLSNLFGRKRYFLICVAAFTVFSLACGLATNLSELIVFRLLQGFFGGGLQPSQQAIVLDTFPREQRSRAFGVVMMAVVVAPVIGPTLGGWLTDNFNWRWVFLINVPVGIVTFIAVAQLVEDPPWLNALRAKQRAAGIDYVGLSLIALGLGALQVVMDRGEDEDWFGSRFIITFAVLACIGIVGASLWLWSAKNPVVNLRLLKDRNFAVGCLLMFCLGGILYSSAVIIPELAQVVLGYTSFLAGLLLSPGAVLVIFTVPIVVNLMPHVQTRWIVAFGFATLGLALVYSHQITPNVDFLTLLLMRTAQSFGLAFLFVPISTIAFATLPQEVNNDATALFTMFRNVAGSIGISAATSFVTERTQVRMAHMVPHLTPLDPGFTALLAQRMETLRAMGTAPAALEKTALGSIEQTLLTQASITAYMDVFAYTALICFAVMWLAFLFSPVKGSAMPAGH